MSKEIKFQEEAHIGILKGVEKLARAVGSTLGPYGRNVIIKKEYNDPHVTKDGVTVADHIRFKNQLEDIGALMVRHAARKTANNSGDGTTTTTVLSHVLIDNLFTNREDLPPIRELRDKLDKYAKEFCEYVEKNKIEEDNFEDMVRKVGIIATNGDKEMAEIVSRCFTELGKYTDIVVDTSPNLETTYNTHKGMFFEGGYKAKEFLTDPERDIVDLRNVLLLITDKKISDDAEIFDIMKKVIGAKKSLLIISPEVSGDAMSLLVRAATKYPGRICVVKSPGVNVRRAEMLEDIAVYTNGKVIKQSTGLTIPEWRQGKSFSEFLGQADRVVIRRDNTTIIGGQFDKKEIEKRVNYIQTQLDQQTDKIMKSRFDKRISGLTGGVAIIHVGGPSDVEIKEKKDRLDDCICAVKAAIEEGITLGGAYMYSKFSKILLDKYGEDVVAELLADSLLAPIKVMWFDNAGQHIPEDYSEYLIENDIVDPVLVLKDCVNNSTSVAYSIISTSTAIINDAETDEILGDLPSFDDDEK